MCACAKCGKPTGQFRSSGRHAKYCSEECQGAGGNYRTCKTCGRQFDSHGAGGWRYCSDACRPYIKAPRDALLCINCGCVVDNPRFKRKFCSAKCRESWKYKGKKQRGFVRSKRKPKPKRERICEQCGCAYVAHRGRLCSTKCRRRSRNKGLGKIPRHCLQCGKQFVSHLPKAKFCCKPCGDKWRRQNPLAPKRRCQGCGDLYSPKARKYDTFCSRECYFNKRRQRPRCDQRAIADGMLWILSRWRQCDICSCMFIGKSASSRLCGRECELAELRKRSCETFYSSRSPTVAGCHKCGRPVIRRDAAGKWISQGFTCEDCLKEARRAANNKAKALRRLRCGALPWKHEVVFKQKVFERDEWKCQICGGPVDRTARPQTPLHAELDHVVPLSRGGAHAYDNTQCTHRICNLAKSSGTQEEAVRGILFVM